jgi:cytochrome c biogenesis factor
VYVLLGVFTPVLSHTLGKKGASALGVAGGVAGAMVAGPIGAAAGATVAAKGFAKDVGVASIGKALAKMAYAIVCFATLFSFVGTVLGGIWADQSWGRFWGWDPKENGALLIVLWNAVVLHARWGGLVRERGVMNMVIVGNIVTAWSWFGVNMLGVGPHSYGFMDGAFRWLMIFVGSQILLIALGSLPLRVWQSFRGKLPPPVPPDAPKSAPVLKPA